MINEYKTNHPRRLNLGFSAGFFRRKRQRIKHFQMLLSAGFYNYLSEAKIVNSRESLMLVNSNNFYCSPYNSSAVLLSYSDSPDSSRALALAIEAVEGAT